MRRGFVTAVNTSTGAVTIVAAADTVTTMPVVFWLPGGYPLVGDAVLYEVSEGDVIVHANLTAGAEGITGEVRAFSIAAARPRWVVANGASVLRATFPRLNAYYSAESYPYGSVDGTHFTLPDYTGDFLRQGAVGAVGGAATHTHPLSAAGKAQITVTTGPRVAINRGSAAAFTSNQEAVVSSINAGGGSYSTGAALDGNTDAASTLPPYSAVVFMVKT